MQVLTVAMTTKKARGPAARSQGGSSAAVTAGPTGLARAFFASLLLFALGPYQLEALEHKNLRFRHISLKEGLSQGVVLSIVQDRSGLMWFGTQEGLNRYDGYQFTTFAPDPNDPTSLLHASVRTVFEDRAGDIWVGTDGGGLSRFDRTTESFTHFTNDLANPASLSNNQVRVIYEDRAGTLWIGTDGGGLNELDRASETFTRFNHNPSNPFSLSHDQIRTIFEDRDGALWVGTTGGGLNKMEPQSRAFRHYRNDPNDPTSLSSDQVRIVYEDANQTLWVGTLGGGLNRFDRKSESFEHFRHDPEDPKSLAHDRVRALHQDSNATLWVATDGGLCEWRPETESFVRYEHDRTDPVSLSDNRVTAIVEDRGSVLWVGTYSGVNAWNIGTGFFTHYKNDGGSEDQPSGNVVFSIAGHEDDVWVATYGDGLNRLDRRSGTFTHYRANPGNPNGLVDDRVMSLAVDTDGIVWAGTFNDGLEKLDPKTGNFTHYRHNPEDPHTLSRNGVTRIFEDSKGVLWVGTYRGGLNRFDHDRNEFIRYQHDDESSSLSNDRVIAMAEGEAGILWIGTDGGGLNRFDTERNTFSVYRHDPDDPTSLSSDHIWVLLKDRQSRLWIGTQGAGLNRWDPTPRRNHRGEFRRYTTRDGLPSGVINGILEDESGHLWISTNRGISKFNPEAETFKNYDQAHGLQSDEFNHGAFYRASDGEMFFGGPNGFNAFYPNRVAENPHPPPVTLTSFLKFNQSVDLGQPVSEVREIELTHKDYVVAFEFAALDYTAPEKNRYMYQLEGFDEGWIDAGTLRRATYTNLGPRKYTFRVKAANNDGLWNEDGLAVSVNVIPPPWRTWWAYTLYGFCLLGFVFAYARRQSLKLEREAKYNRTLQLEVEARTQELAQQNKELAAFNRKLEEASLTDSLTGFWNRRFLLQQIPRELAQVTRQLKREADGQTKNEKSLLFLMFDLDGFKGLNDTYGHAAGDRVLIQVRKMLLDVCRQSDTIIRWGGDEFLLVGRHADPETAEHLAERIRQSMEEKAFDVGLEQTVHLSCSIGFAFYPFDRSRPNFFSWEQVVGIADRALYVAKESGRNAWAGILGNRIERNADLLTRINEDLEQLVAEGVVEIRDSGGTRRPRLVRNSRMKAGLS
jgi:diguanylate cyclase (GGDEF)-like protein